MQDVLDALTAEQNALEEILTSLDADAWARPSACEGWMVADVVLHLAQTEEAVDTSTRGQALALPSVEASTVDEVVDAWVAGERGAAPGEVFTRWKRARRAALDSLRTADPTMPVNWVAAPLKPRTLATTRLSEHWIHALDITDPLGLDYPDTDRLWHVARLAHRTLPYAYESAGRTDPPSVRMELTAPCGETWTLGADDASCVIAGTASEFCRVAARRLRPSDATTLGTSGPYCDEVLQLVRTYA